MRLQTTLDKVNNLEIHIVNLPLFHTTRARQEPTTSSMKLVKIDSGVMLVGNTNLTIGTVNLTDLGLTTADLNDVKVGYKDVNCVTKIVSSSNNPNIRK